MFNTVFYTIAVVAIVGLAIYDGQLVKRGKIRKQTIKSPTAVLLLVACFTGIYALLIMKQSSARDITEAVSAIFIVIFEIANIATRRIK